MAPLANQGPAVAGTRRRTLVFQGHQRMAEFDRKTWGIVVLYRYLLKPAGDFGLSEFHVTRIADRQSNIMGLGHFTTGFEDRIVVNKREKVNVAFGYATIENDSSSL